MISILPLCWENLFGVWKMRTEILAWLLMRSRQNICRLDVLDQVLATLKLESITFRKKPGLVIWVRDQYFEWRVSGDKQENYRSFITFALLSISKSDDFDRPNTWSGWPPTVSRSWWSWISFMKTCDWGFRARNFRVIATDRANCRILLEKA